MVKRQETANPLKKRIRQFNFFWSKIKRNGCWIFCIAFLFVGIDYLLQDTEIELYSAELTFMVDFEEILLLSDLKKKNANGLSRRRQTRNRERQVLNLLNDVLKAQDFQAKILFKKISISGKNDFIANHILQYQPVFQRRSSDQKNAKEEVDLIGFKFSHSQVDRFTKKEQRAFKRLSRQLPRRMRPIRDGFNVNEFNVNEFNEDSQDQLVESDILNDDLMGNLRNMPTSFSFRARSHNPILATLILDTFYKNFSKYLDSYHYQLLYTTRELLKLEIDGFEKELNNLNRKTMIVEERMRNTSSNMDFVPLILIKQKKDFLLSSPIYKNRMQLLFQLDLISIKSYNSPFTLISPPVFPVLSPPNVRKEMIRALVIFSIGLTLSTLFILIRQPVIDTIRLIVTIWREEEENYSEKTVPQRKRKH